MSDKKKIVNVIITNVSSISEYNYEKRRYVYENDAKFKNEEDTIEGCFTNEPAIKYLIKKLKKEGQKLDEIMFITSNQVRKTIKRTQNSKLESDYADELITKIKDFCTQENININSSDINNIIEFKENKLIITKGHNPNELIVQLSKNIIKNEFEQDYPKENNKDITTFQVLIDKIEKFCEKEKINKSNRPRINTVDLGEGNNESDVVKAVMKVKNALVKLLKDKNTYVNVYIESNGGIRYATSMLINILNSLEKTYDNIKVKSIFSIALFDKEPDKNGRIYIRNTYMMYASTDLSSTIVEFTHYGRIKFLTDYFARRKEVSTNKKVFKDIDRCINKLHKLSDDLQLCRTEQIIDDFYGINNIQLELKKFVSDYKNSTSDNVDAQIFIYVIQEILKEYEMIYKHKYDDKFLNLPTIIQWCIDKDYIQQALTFCSERLPKYMVEMGIININDDLISYAYECDTKKNYDYEENYYLLTQFFINHYRRLVSYIKLDELLKLAINNNIITQSQYNRYEDGIKNKINNDKYNALFENIRNTFKQVLSKTKIEDNTISIRDWCLKNLNDNINTEKIRDLVQNLRFPQYNEYNYKYTMQYVNDIKNKIEEISTEEINNSNKYIKDSLNYAYFDLLDNKYLTTMDIDTFIKIQVIYGILKEQRDLSNHASDGNRQQSDNVLSMEQIKVLIKEELNVINEYNNKHNK